MFKNSRDKDNRGIQASLKRFGETFVGSGNFVCRGVEGYFSVEKISANSGKRVTVSASYVYNDVPWIGRIKFEEEAKRLILSKLKEYEIEQIEFHNRY